MSKKLTIVVILLCATMPVFAQSVDTAWVRRYNDPGNYDDLASSIAVDGSGNVYVTGVSVGSGTYSDYTTIKYYPNGDTAWVRGYNGPGNYYDEASAIAVDGSDNIYVTGKSYGNGTFYDYATIKYYPDGDTAWVRRYNGSENYHDGALAIAVDDQGNVYVTGTSSGGGTLDDYATIKYYTNGDTAWVRRYDGPGHYSDVASAIAVDDSGNVYVTGTSYTGGAYQDYATIKYKPSGDTAWVRRYDGPGNYYDQPSAIAVDSFGHVYVTGSSYGSVTYEDFATIRYSTNGDTVWVRRYDGPAGYYDYAYALAVDGLGNVYVTGSSYGGIATSDDYATIKYYSNGDTAWTRRYNAQTYSIDGANSIAVDGFGNVYATGYMDGSSGGAWDYGTIKYHPNGDIDWVRRYNGPGHGDDRAKAIIVDDSGNVYVTGYSVGSGTNYDYNTIKYVQFMRGDANKNGKVSVADCVYMINFLFKGGAPIKPIQAGDTNCDGKTSIADVVYLINYLLRGGPPLCI